MIDTPGLTTAVITGIVPEQHAADIQFRDDAERMSNVKVTGRVYWNLQVGDIVLVGFISGLRANPVIIDKILLPGDELLEDSDPDDIHLRHVVKDQDDNVTGKIDIRADKDGNLTLTISGEAGNLTLNIEGAEGNITANIQGDAKITADGIIDLIAKGKVTVDGETVELGSNLAKQLVDNLPNCLFTGAPHQLGRVNVKT